MPKPPTRIWIVDIKAHGSINETWSKVFDAPKYMVERYAKRVLKEAYGCARVRQEVPRVFFGYTKGSPIADYIARLRFHTLRTREDELLK